MDVRMYNQQNLFLYYNRDVGVFSTIGEMAKKFRGPIGCCTFCRRHFGGVHRLCLYLYLPEGDGRRVWGRLHHPVCGCSHRPVAELSSLFENWGVLKTNADFLKPAYQFLDLPQPDVPGVADHRKARRPQVRGGVPRRLLRYPSAETWALRHVNVRFRVGERMAVGRRDGSGKTTFIKLLCRLYDPQEGEILLNGIDIRKYNYREYMNIFSVVFRTSSSPSRWARRGGRGRL